MCDLGEFYLPDGNFGQLESVGSWMLMGSTYGPYNDRFRLSCKTYLVVKKHPDQIILTFVLIKICNSVFWLFKFINVK